MADRTVSGQVKVAERGLDPVLGGSGVDRDDAVAGRDEREVAEVVAQGMPGAELGADVAPVQNVAQDPVHVPWLPPWL